MRRSEFLVIIYALTLGLAIGANLPEIKSYAKVTKNGEDTNNVKSNGPLTWLIKKFSSMENKTKDDENKEEGRSNQDISITVSPVYIPPRIPELHKGEAVDYPTTKKYSTLDEEMIAQLDNNNRKQQRNKPFLQDRFHPPAKFEHDIAHGNAAALKQTSSSMSSQPSSSASSSSTSVDSGPPSDQSDIISADDPGGYSSPMFPGSYDYKPPSFYNAKPMQSPDSYSPPDSIPKGLSSFDPSSISYGQSPPDSYSPPIDYPDHHSHHSHHHHHHSHHESDPELNGVIEESDYGSKPVFKPPKSIEYAGHFDHPAFVDDPYIHDHDHDYHHDIIYDHIPDDHTTPAPEMMDQRLNKKPYSYYFIGKKLWYVPLYFSIYFIIYIAALILRSISRHKINLPETWAAAVSRRSLATDSPGWLDLTVKVLDGIEAAKKVFEKKKT